MLECFIENNLVHITSGDSVETRTSNSFREKSDVIVEITYQSNNRLLVEKGVESRSSRTKNFWIT